MMRLTRRRLLALFGAAAAAPVLRKVPVVEAATTDQSIVGMDILLFPPGPYVPPRFPKPDWGSLYSDELSRVLKEQVQPLMKFKVEGP